MRKKNLEIFQTAVDMAASGKFKNWKQIQDDLVEKGFRRAPDLLDGDKIRALLDMVCAKGPRGKAGAR